MHTKYSLKIKSLAVIVAISMTLMPAVPFGGAAELIQNNQLNGNLPTIDPTKVVADEQNETGGGSVEFLMKGPLTAAKAAVTDRDDLRMHGDAKEAGTGTDRRIEFDGTGDHATLTRDLGLGTGDWTIETRIKFDRKQEETIFSNGNHLNGGLSIIRHGAINRWDIVYAGDNNMSVYSNMEVGREYHLALVRRGQTLSLYQDGQLLKQVSLKNDAALNSQRDLHFGSKVGGSQMFFDGTMRDFRISKVARYSGAFQLNGSENSSDQDTVLLLGFRETVTTTPAPNQAPVFNVIGNRSVDENVRLRFTLNATDADGDNLIYSASNLPSGAIFNPSTRIFDWTPNLNQAGTYDIPFTVSDGTLLATQTVRVVVANTVEVPAPQPNRAPTLNAVNDKNVNENNRLRFTLAGSDPDNDPLTYSVSGLPGGASFNPSTRIFDWTPNFNQAGTYNVTFAVSDGTLSTSHTVTISVANSNRAPFVGNLTSNAVDRDPGTAGMQVYPGDQVTYSGLATDLDGEEVSWQWLYKVDGGAEVLVNSGTGSIQDVNFTYPQTAASRNYEWILRVSDSLQQIERKLAVQLIREVVQAPQTQPGTNDMGDLRLHADAKEIGAGADRRIDFDGVGDHATLRKDLGLGTGDWTVETRVKFDRKQEETVFSNGNHTNGGLSIIRHGAINRWDIVYAGDNNMSVTSTMEIGKEYHIALVRRGQTLSLYQDGLLLRQIRLKNDAVFNSQRDLHFGSKVGGSQMFFDGTMRDFRISQVARYNGAFQLDGNENARDQDTILLLGFRTGTSPAPPAPAQNTPPVLNRIGDRNVDENVRLRFTLNGSDVDGDPLIYTAIGLPAGASFNRSTRIFDWTPNANQAGTYNVVFNVSDGTETVSEIVTLRVANTIQDPTPPQPNRAPILNPIGNQNAMETERLRFTLNGADADGDPLTYAATGLPRGASFNQGTRVFDWTPDLNQSGTYNLTFTVSDGKLSATQTVRIVIANKQVTPTPPQPQPGPTNGVHRLDETLVLEAEAIAAIRAPMEVVPSGEGISGGYVVSRTTTGQNVPVAERGAVTFRVNVEKPGQYVMWAKVRANTGFSDSFFVDVDGAIDVFDAGGARGWRWVKVKGRKMGNPRKFNFGAGEHEISFLSREAGAGLDQIILTKDMSFVPGVSPTPPPAPSPTPPSPPTNVAPVLNLIGDKNARENSRLRFTLSGSDVDNDSLTYLASNLPTGAVFNQNTRTFDWTPNFNQAGTYNITFRLSDGTESVSETITLTVANTNRSPVINNVTSNAVDKDSNVAGVQVYGNDQVTYQASVNDPDGDSLQWEWLYKVNGGAEITYRSGVGRHEDAIFTYPVVTSPTSYEWIFRVSDGAIQRDQSMVIQVIPEPQPDPVPPPPASTPALRVLANGQTNIAVADFALDAVMEQASTNDYLMVAQTDTTANATTNGKATVRLNVEEAGDYIIWARVMAETPATDSFFVEMDGVRDVFDAAGEVFVAGERFIRLNGRAGGAALTLDPRVFNLTEGEHELSFYGREMNTRLYGLIITNDLSFVPEGATPPDPAPTPPTPTPPTPEPPAPTPPAPAPSPVEVFQLGESLELEAEAIEAIKAPMKVKHDDAGATEGYIVSNAGNANTPETDRGEIRFKVNVAQAGDYVIWAKVKAETGTTDSFYLNVNGVEDVFDAGGNTGWQWKQVNGRAGTSNPGTLSPRLLRLGVGEHEIAFQSREAGTKLDKFLITSDLSFVPEGAVIPDPAPAPTPPTPTPTPPTNPDPVPTYGQGREVFVTANVAEGSSNADGSQANPYNFHDIIAEGANLIQPGDVVWLRGGNYSQSEEGGFVSYLNGTKEQPILVMSYPGEMASFDGGLSVYGTHTTYAHINLHDLDSNHIDLRGGSQQSKLSKGSYGMLVRGVGNRFINNYSHEGIMGVAAFTGNPDYEAGDLEVYGNIYWNNGWDSSDRLHGHGGYVQNTANSKKVFSNNIFTRNFGSGMNARGAGAQVKNIDFIDNVFIRDYFWVGVANPMEDIVVHGNMTYRTRNGNIDAFHNGFSYTPRQFMNEGYGESHPGPITVTDNYLVGGALLQWMDDGAMTFTGNTVIKDPFGDSDSANNPLSIGQQNFNDIRTSYYMNNNAYYGSHEGNFVEIHDRTPGIGTLMTFEDWKRTYGQDANSTWHESHIPQENTIFVKPNAYTRGRGHVVAYNWEMHDVVRGVDVTELGLVDGDEIKIRNAEDPLGKEIILTVRENSQGKILIDIPMTGWEIDTFNTWETSYLDYVMSKGRDGAYTYFESTRANMEIYAELPKDELRQIINRYFDTVGTLGKTEALRRAAADLAIKPIGKQFNTLIIEKTNHTLEDFAAFFGGTAPNPSPAPQPNPTPQPNNPPLLQAVAVQVIDEGERLTFTLQASDQDNDVLVYSAQNLPQGATLNQNTGAFSWTPAEDQSGTYTLTFRARDQVSEVSIQVSIIVRDVPQAPAPNPGPVLPTELGAYRLVQLNGITVRGSGVLPDLILNNLSAVDLAGGGLDFESPAIAASQSAATNLVNAMKATNEITVEAWIRPSSLLQTGPARILTLSSDTGNRNFTLGQEGDQYVFRLRTTETDLNGAEQQLATVLGAVDMNEPQHVVFTRGRHGNAKIYLNGALVGSSTIGGSFSNWDSNFRLALANELTNDRAWLGKLYHVALHDGALDAETIRDRFNAGIPGA